MLAQMGLYPLAFRARRITVKLSKRILYLSDDLAELKTQLEGGNLQSSPHELTFGVNTDAMISGRACTLGYTPEVLGPYFLQNFREVIQESDVADGDFQVIVGGHAYGTGSSREAAVVAHRGAGIELVVAQSFQRIFQENMVYDGLPFTTDFGVIDRLQAGEDVDPAEFTASLPPFFRAVAEQGGLLAYGTSLLGGQIQPDTTGMDQARPMNVVEKIVAATAFRGLDASDGGASVSPGMQVLCRAGFRGMHEYTAGMVLNLYEQAWGKVDVERPELAASFEDHFVLIDHEAVPDHVKASRLGPAKRLTAEMVDVCKHYGIKIHGPGRDLPAGVCHRIVVEDYALPGSIVVLTDSHTPTAGVLNAFAFGVGSTAMAFALRTGLIPVTVPKVVRVIVEGKADGRVTPKDLILHLIGDPYFRNEEWRESPTDTCVMQLGGPGLDD